MSTFYLFRVSFVVIHLVLVATQLKAQGDTCTTALQIASGVHYADGPTTGDGIVPWSQGGGLGCGGAAANGDWYVYTATFNGTIAITTCHPLNNQMNDDTYLKVLTGTCSNLTCVGYNDDMSANACPGYNFASYLEVNVTAGQDYFIVWTDLYDNDAFYWELSECAGTVTGTTYGDTDNSGTQDPGEAQVNTMLLIEPGGQYAYSSQEFYSFCSDLGAHTISVPNPPLYHVTVPLTRNYMLATQGMQITGMNFGFQGIPGIYDASVDLWGWNPWIGNNTQMHIHYANIGTEPIDASVTLTLDPLLSYVSANVTASSVVGQEVTWDLGALAPGTSATINVAVFTSITASPNAPTLSTVLLSTQETDIALANNMDDLHGFATTSYDPNDKQVDRTSINPTDVLEQKPLEYTVRFQNTGNAPAVNVVIKDTLDGDWDLATFEMIAATHPYTLTISNEVAIWTFANIMLPDSASDPLGSQGSFQYRMAPKSSLVLGDMLTNRADIYFDYNAPVLTNTTVTVVELSTSITDRTNAGGLSIQPVPSCGPVVLRWSAADVTNARLTVLDALGRTAYTGTIQHLAMGGVLQLDLALLPQGSYVARIDAAGGEARCRFIIQR